MTSPNIYAAPAGHLYVPGETFSSLDGGIDTLRKSYWAALKPDGTRESIVISAGVTTSSPQRLAEHLHIGYPEAEIYYIRNNSRDYPGWAYYYNTGNGTSRLLPAAGGPVANATIADPIYFDYDWNVSLVPVNQVPEGREWKAQIARFAHQLVSDYSENYHLLRQNNTHLLGPGSGHSHTDLNAMRAKNTLRWGRGIVGVAFKAVSEWMDLDSVITEQTPDAENWKLQKPSVERIMIGICASCASGTWVRKFSLRHDVLSFDGMLNGGTIASPRLDGTGDTGDRGWPPHEVLHRHTILNHLEQWNELFDWFGRAVDYYDDHVGELIDHDH